MEKNNNFIDNEMLLAEVIACKQTGVISNKLARMLMLLTEKYSYHRYFIGYTYREDMIADALLNLSQRALQFDPSKSSNPFAYYTQAVYRSFRQFIQNEKKQRNIKDQLLIDIGANPSFNFQQEYSELKAMCGDTAEELKELEIAISEIKENIVQEVKPTKKKKQKTELDPDVFIL